MTTFHLPDLGEGLHEAEIVTWHVAVGDRVTANQPLVSVETAKAIVEIPSPWSGLVTSVHGEPGDLLEVGEELVEFSLDEEKDSETVVGRLPHGNGDEREKSRRPKPHRGGLRASPAVRRAARDLEVDLSALRGTGPNGTITIADVEKGAHERADFVGGDRLTGPLRSMAKTMAEARKNIVPSTITEMADISAWAPGEEPMLRLIAALIAGCAAEPRLNAWYDGNDFRISVHDQINVGIAVDIPDGLFLPVIRDVQKKNPDQLRAEIARLIESVKNRTIAPEGFRDPTISLSNFGMIAGVHAGLVVPPPQVAILGAGRISDRPIAREGAAVVARTMPLSLSFDHRPITGGEAGRFLRAVMRSLEAK